MISCVLATYYNYYLYKNNLKSNFKFIQYFLWRRRRMAACHMVGISNLCVCSFFFFKFKKRSKSNPFLKIRNQFLCKVDIFEHVLVKPCLYIVLFIWFLLSSDNTHHQNPDHKSSNDSNHHEDKESPNSSESYFILRI